MNPLDLGRLLYEARVRAAWGKQADYRLSQEPYPEHLAAEMPESCWLAIQQAKAVLRDHAVLPTWAMQVTSGSLVSVTDGLQARSEANGEAKTQ